ncbi:MAG: transglycosylase SLT domain-containing protein [Pseudobdellovibrionaceae bacterium]
MRQLNILISMMYVCSSAMAQERPFTPIKKDFTENGVPFVVDVSSEYMTEGPKSEMAEKISQEEAEDSKFTQVVDEDTPVSHEEIVGEKNLTTSRPWKASDFTGQGQALGYSADTFAIPKGLEVNVKFWIDVYSKYNTDQGVLHDSDNIDLIYEELDFGSISMRTDLNLYQKEAAKVRMVKDGKKRVIDMLERFHTLKDPSSLPGKERKIWDYFEKIDEKDKFIVASKKNRLRFQLGQKDRVIQGIYFSGRYIEEFEKVFRDAGLPVELARLPFVESSYNVLARSKVGASGLWQIMPYTMKGFMKRDPAIDLRNHPMEATKLAAKLLRINYNMLQSWPLALTGYNFGPSGVLRVTKKFQSRDISDLVQNKRFGFASRNFYASFLASLEVTSNAPKYLGAVSWSQTLDSVDIKLPLPVTYMDLMRWFDGDDLKTQIFNPHITRLARTRGRPIPKTVVVSVPKVKLALVMKELESPEALKKAQSIASADGRMPSAIDIQPITYRVRRGDNLRKIAEHFGIPETEILSANNIGKTKKLRPGQVIMIP